MLMKSKLLVYPSFNITKKFSIQFKSHGQIEIKLNIHFTINILSSWLVHCCKIQGTIQSK
ncbi:hypothetical protein BpHYR1_040290 [Brachionus plicatilis]|uniref:Uncharacterized protein n=1 Tax=Brachionus plicatilis TaxID=10195 RepID=A0A3M7R8J5_BRAPC|nr:hypothetical protein BpHYR1_040290 [Brachionus plicatilis]